MNEDVSANLEKLMDKYVIAQSKIEGLRASPVPNGRRATRVSQAALKAVGTLQEGRKAASRALVRLAYVRALREARPGARMTQEQEREVESLWYRLDRALGQTEWSAVVRFKDHLRKTRVIGAVGSGEAAMPFVEAIRVADRPYPLELRARASVLEVLEMASAAGALAGTSAGDYDTANS